MMGRWKLKPGQWAGDQILGDRASQQDAYDIQDMTLASGEPALVMVLADGMGGHRGGADAAEAAVKRAMRAMGSAESLTDALEDANHAVLSVRETRDESYADMGCTLVIAVIMAKGVQWISVGDSPLWLIRNKSLIRLNRDHSMAPVLSFMAQNGDITEEDAALDPRRNQLRSALTGGDIALIDESEAPVPLKPGDQILLASDGLNGLPEDEIVATLQSSDGAAAICAQLLHQLRDAVPGGLDNSTAIVYKERKRGWL